MWGLFGEGHFPRPDPTIHVYAWVTAARIARLGGRTTMLLRTTYPVLSPRRTAAANAANAAAMVVAWILRMLWVTD